MDRLRSPIRYFGGKGNMVSKILPIVEGCSHRIYVELFGGGGSILMAKRAVGVEVYNDIDSSLYDFFGVVSNPRQFAKFYRRVALLPYSRQLFNDCRLSWRDEPDLIDRVVKWYVVARQSFSGIFGSSWSFAVTASHRGMAGSVSKWLSAIDKLPEIHSRLSRVQIECNDWRKVLTTYDTAGTLFYCDPPYVLSTRKSGGYSNEMTDEDHIEFVERVLTLKGSVVVSGYNNPIYDRLTEAGWKRIDFKTACYAAGKTRTSKLQGAGNALKHAGRTESLWVCGRLTEDVLS